MHRERKEQGAHRDNLTPLGEKKEDKNTKKIFLKEGVLTLILENKKEEALLYKYRGTLKKIHGGKHVKAQR